MRGLQGMQEICLNLGCDYIDMRYEFIYVHVCVIYVHVYHIRKND